MKKLVLSEKQYKKLQNIIIEREILNEQSKSEKGNRKSTEKS